MTGWATESITRCTMSPDSGWSSCCDRITTNSSPDRRATVSVSRSDERRRAATVIRSTSPALWPMLSLTNLKRSRSISITHTGWPLRVA
jgi:hypothetical protein